MPRLLLLLTFAAAAAAQTLTDRERQLLERVERLEARLAALEGHLAPAPVPAATAAPDPAAPPVAPRGVTVAAALDVYAQWNGNLPAGGTNALRAYDVTANGMAINQAALLIESAADPAAGRRWGYRLDLLFGQATETLQGSPANEPRPAVWRNLFQAYGTYVAPVGRGLTIDAGKWASSLGYEGNYTKDQINYSRGYFFNFLPYYHMGLRVAYPVNDRVQLGYWLVNGANQTEDFNRYRSQLAQVVVKPARSLTWTAQYYAGREQPLPAAGPAPRGRFHVLDTYAAWTPSPRWTLAGELDLVVSRVTPASAPQRVTGGAAYARFALTPKLAFGQRFTRLNDRGGLFSGRTQSLWETTSTVSYRFEEGFEARLEYRRDASGEPFFPGSDPAHPRRAQSTATLGLLWWFGGRTGGW